MLSLASAFYVASSLILPLLLTSLESIHVTKHFSDVSWLCFRVRLINQCKRRTKLKRHVPPSRPSRLPAVYCPTGIDIFDNWLVENHFSPISTVPTWKIPTSYPARAFRAFTRTFDPLAIYHMINQLFDELESPLSETAFVEAGQLGMAVSLTSPSCLSSLERCHYETVVGSSYPGAHLAPFATNDLPIVIDTGASRSLSPVRADVTSFKKINRRLHGISADTNIEGEGMTSWDVTDQNGITSAIKTMAFYVPKATI